MTLVETASAEPKRKLQVGERGPDGRIFLGHAVVDGKIMFSSVSSIKKFDPEYDGCQRRWFYQFREGKKESKTAAQTGGTEYGKQLEAYLKTGVDKMQPVLQPVKHLFPKPGPDLEVEKDLALDIGRAIGLRKILLGADDPGRRLEMRRFAGLVAADVPIVGAADVRHRRGEYVDAVGQVRVEDRGMRVVSIDDLKSTKRINDHITRTGKLLKGWALTAEEVVVDTQMIGYGVHASDLYPDTTHLRLAHNYAQTENGLAGARRMGLVSVEHVRRRWEERVEPVVREMIDVAAAGCAQDVSVNTKACRSFGRECPHLSYCQPARTLGDVFDFNIDNGEQTMGNGFFDSLTSTNGVAQASEAQPEGLGLFGGPSAPVVEPPPIPAPVMSDAERQRQIEEEKQRLRMRNPLADNEGYTVGQNCNGNGYYASRDGHGFIPIEVGHVCSRCAKPPTLPHVGAVNPIDAPPFDPVEASKPLAAEEIEKIEDSEIKGRAQAIAKAAQERAALDVSGQEKKKTSGNCSAGGTTVLLTDREKVTRDKLCPNPDCGKKLRIKDKDFTHDLTSMVVPKHRLRGEVAVPAPKVVQVESAPPQAAEAPALPAEAPALPEPPALPETPVMALSVPPYVLPPSLPEAVLPPPLPVVSPMNSLTLIKHIVQGVRLGLEDKASAFDRIDAVLSK